MKKRRLLLIALACILIGSVFMPAACNDDDEPAHTHTFSDEWSSDATHHWHAATCDHTDETSDRAKHDWDDGEVTTAPTETKEGVKML